MCHVVGFLHYTIKYNLGRGSIAGSANFVNHKFHDKFANPTSDTRKECDAEWDYYIKISLAWARSLDQQIYQSKIYRFANPTYLTPEKSVTVKPLPGVG